MTVDLFPPAYGLLCQISSEIILIGTLMTFQQFEVVPIIGRYITIPLK